MDSHFGFEPGLCRSVIAVQCQWWYVLVLAKAAFNLGRPGSAQVHEDPPEPGAEEAAEPTAEAPATPSANPSGLAYGILSVQSLPQAVKQKFQKKKGREVFMATKSKVVLWRRVNHGIHGTFWPF